MVSDEISSVGDLFATKGGFFLKRWDDKQAWRFINPLFLNGYTALSVIEFLDIEQLASDEANVGIECS